MLLSINIDHIATLRNARGGNEPDPILAAKICEEAGADGIVCHLREDRRHIRDNDVVRLRKSITTKLDLEMSIAKDVVTFAEKIVPDLVTLVPEKRQELTTEGGLDVQKQRKKIQNVIKRMHDNNIPVSLFIDPIKKQIEIAKEIGSDMIELHTGDFANAVTEKNGTAQLKRLQIAATFAHSFGLTVNAGHGLNYENIYSFLSIREIEEISIGHAIITRTAFVGLYNAVKEMRKIVKKN